MSRKKYSGIGNPRPAGFHVRRTLLAVCTALTAATITGPTWAQSTSKDPVKIGVLQSLSGAFAPIGTLGVKGAQLAIEGEEILGRPIQLVVEDDQSDPKVGAQKARKMIDLDKVVAIEGMVGSSIG